MYSCCCMDYEPYRFAKVRVVTARVPHKCGECGELVKSGDQYELVSALDEGRWVTHKTCSFCLAIRRDFFDCGWAYGFLVEDFAECNGWDYRELPEDDD